MIRKFFVLTTTQCPTSILDQGKPKQDPLSYGLSAAYLLPVMRTLQFSRVRVRDDHESKLIKT